MKLDVSQFRRNPEFRLMTDSSVFAMDTICTDVSVFLAAALVILAIVVRVRDRDQQTRAAAAAEVRALQARMNPHFLGNALNAIAALAVIAPAEVPRAAGRLRQFLRASFDQHERTLVPLEEELALVSAYLDIELPRIGNRLKVERAIHPCLSKVLIPPFSLQPLVENAVQHGIPSSPRAGRVFLLVRPVGGWLELSVSDDGQGVSSTEIEKVFFAERPRVHALVLLRRRLQGLFGRSFQLEVRSEVGEGTMVTLRIPLGFENANGALEAVAGLRRGLAS
jgi:two-component system sensor histidine kinase LytS